MDFRKLRTNVLLGVILLAGILVISLVVVRFNAQKNLSTSQDVYVQVENVEATSIGDLSELSGTLEPIEEATVSFEVSGMVESLNVQEGSSVNAGEILAGVDSKNYDLQSQQAGNQLQVQKRLITWLQLILQDMKACIMPSDIAKRL